MRLRRPTACDFSGWNFGIDFAGFGGMLIAFVILFGWLAGRRPGGARLAVYLGLNLEHFAFGQGLGAELAPGANGGGGPQPDVLNYAWRDWGNRVGAWRIRDLLDALQMPASHLAQAWGARPVLVLAAHAGAGALSVIIHG